jgi:hypothetical protein
VKWGFRGWSDYGHPTLPQCFCALTALLYPLADVSYRAATVMRDEARSIAANFKPA